MSKELITKVKSIHKKKSELTDWEKDFIKGMIERIDKYGDATAISEKQAAVIEKCFDKINGKPVSKPVKSEVSGVSSDTSDGGVDFGYFEEVV